MQVCLWMLDSGLSQELHPRGMWAPHQRAGGLREAFWRPPSASWLSPGRKRAAPLPAGCTCPGLPAPRLVSLPGLLQGQLPGASSRPQHLLERGQPEPWAPLLASSLWADPLHLHSTHIEPGLPGVAVVSHRGHICVCVALCPARGDPAEADPPPLSTRTPASSSARAGGRLPAACPGLRSWLSRVLSASCVCVQEEPGSGL